MSRADAGRRVDDPDSESDETEVSNQTLISNKATRKRKKRPGCRRKRKVSTPTSVSSSGYGPSKRSTHTANPSNTSTRLSSPFVQKRSQILQDERGTPEEKRGVKQAKKPLTNSAYRFSSLRSSRSNGGTNGPVQNSEDVSQAHVTNKPFVKGQTQASGVSTAHANDGNNTVSDDATGQYVVSKSGLVVPAKERVSQGQRSKPSFHVKSFPVSHTSSRAQTSTTNTSSDSSAPTSVSLRYSGLHGNSATSAPFGIRYRRPGSAIDLRDTGTTRPAHKLAAPNSGNFCKNKTSPTSSSNGSGYARISSSTRGTIGSRRYPFVSQKLLNATAELPSTPPYVARANTWCFSSINGTLDQLKPETWATSNKGCLSNVKVSDETLVKNLRSILKDTQSRDKVHKKSVRFSDLDESSATV